MAEVTISTGGEQTGSGSGSVTSVNVSGGTTGLTTSGGPITSSGTITVSGTLAIANGGTGQTTANAAFNALSPNTTRGDITVRNATVNARLALGSAGTILRSDGTDLGYSTATFPNTTTANQLLYSTAANVVGGSTSLTFNGSTLNITTNTASGSNNGLNIFNTSTTGQGNLYISGDRATFGSYGGFLMGGSAHAAYTFFGLANLADKLLLFADGASNKGLYMGTVSAQSFGIGTNNVMRATISSAGLTTWTSAYHVLSAGTASANTAPLKFVSGTSLTSAEAGAVEFTTDDLFFTITTGTSRKRLLMADATGGLTSGRIPYATTNGRLTDSSGLTFDGTNFTTTGSVTTTQIIASNKSINTTAGDSAIINAMAGRFRKDTTGSTFTLTNSFITANSIILCSIVTDLTSTGNAVTVVAGSGSAVFTFWTVGTGASAPSTDTDVNFLVVN